MEDFKELIIVKASDVQEAFNTLLNEIRELRKQVNTLQNREEEMKAYSPGEAATLIGFHYKTILKMVRKGVLVPVHTDKKNGRYRITASSIKAYMENRKSKK